MNDNESGWFLVRVDVDKGILKTSLPGDGYITPGPGHELMAMAIESSDWGDAMAEERSPLYRVKACDLSLAMDIADRMSEDDGREALARAVLGIVRLPKSELSKRVRDAVMGVTGLAELRNPYEMPMSVGDVEQLATEVKEINDEAH